MDFNTLLGIAYTQIAKGEIQMNAIQREEMGWRIRKKRELLGLRQDELALKAKTTTQTISMAECGKRKLYADTLFLIADALEESVVYLYTGKLMDNNIPEVFSKLNDNTSKHVYELIGSLANILKEK